MSLNKAIFHKKEKRTPYYDSRRFDYTCRNHKSCKWCFRNRIYKFLKKEIEFDDKYKEYLLSID